MNNGMKMIDLTIHDQDYIQQTAAILQASFESWPTLEIAKDEVLKSLDSERISRVMINADGKVVGWIGGISQYSGNVWELHPLVVHQEYRNQGIGKALVQDLEQQVKNRGGITIYLGTDDEYDQTSLSGQDVYGDIPGFIQNFASHDHPAIFYQKQGYVIVGILPDANGIGKPDIWMAKRVK
ncbi:GNAT family N-acetyltransferase [Paenibacillus marinisediminis]